MRALSIRSIATVAAAILLSISTAACSDQGDEAAPAGSVISPPSDSASNPYFDGSEPTRNIPLGTSSVAGTPASDDSLSPNEGDPLLDPFYKGRDLAAPPEKLLEELVRVSCDQSATDLDYWDDANHLYGSVTGYSDRYFVRDWPETLPEAMNLTCAYAPLEENG